MPSSSLPYEFDLTSLYYPPTDPLWGHTQNDILSPLNPFTPLFPLDNETDSSRSSPIGTPPDVPNVRDFANDDYLSLFSSPKVPTTIAPNLLFSGMDDQDYPQRLDEYLEEPIGRPTYDSDPTRWLDHLNSQQVVLRSIGSSNERPIFVADSDGDDDSSDGDYVPSPKAGSGSRKRGRSTSSGTSDSNAPRAKRVAYTVSSSHSPSATPSSAGSPLPQTHHSVRAHPPPRNTQVTINLDEIQMLNFVCPVEDCNWNKLREGRNGDDEDDGKKKKRKKKNDDSHNHRRLPDFKRHLKSHMKPNHIKCIGVRVSEASQYIVRPGAEPYDIGVEGEEQYIGGCLESFSRSDALKRHIKTSSCVGHDKRR